MELKIDEIKALEPIKFNYAELKEEITKKCDLYKNTVYTEETIKEAKEDRAKLNNLSKKLNDSRIEKEREFMKSFEQFKKEIKDLTDTVSVASKNIDEQVKAFEKKEQDEKLEEIVKFFEENVGDYKKLIDFDKIFVKEWLNKGYSIDKVQLDIKHMFSRAKMDLEVITGQIKDEAVSNLAKNFYFRNINNSSALSLALQEASRIIDNNKKLEELKQKEAEQNNNKIEQKDNNICENISKNEEIKTNKAELLQIDFRVWVTSEQKILLRDFLIENNIKYGGVK